jgi:hypothetical protein
MTVKQFKHWFEGFTDALKLDLVSGFDHDDLEDIFDTIRKKMDEIETKESIKVSENLPHISGIYTHPMHKNPHIPNGTPGIWYTNGTPVDRLNTWPGSPSLTNENEK